MLGKHSLLGILWEVQRGWRFGIEMNISSISRYAYREGGKCMYLTKISFAMKVTNKKNK